MVRTHPSFCVGSVELTRPSRFAASNGIGIAGGGLLGWAIGQVHGTLKTWKYEYVQIYKVGAL